MAVSNPPQTLCQTKKAATKAKVGQARLKMAQAQAQAR